MHTLENIYAQLATILADIVIPHTSLTLLDARVVDAISHRKNRITILWIPQTNMSRAFVTEASNRIQQELRKDFATYSIRVHTHYVSDVSGLQETTKHQALARSPYDEAQHQSKRPPSLLKTMVIAVGAGKGGVGKSTLSFFLGKALQQADKNLTIGILDADIYGPSLPTLIHKDGGQKPHTQRLETMNHKGLVCASFGYAISSDSAAVWRGPMVHKALQQLVHGVSWKPLDILIVDLPPGTGDVPISMHKILGIDAAILVTTPHVLSQADTLRATHMFSKLHIPIGAIVSNMATITCPTCAHTMPLFQSEQPPPTFPKTQRQVNIPFTPSIKPAHLQTLADIAYALFLRRPKEPLS
ncbi:MAG: P-loop NTPase [Alphaproteobacteria bacterium]|nr:MAG: P-loop NTPase [Alphaproteobacteria bacterium]